jgi:2-methylcitrate dehydratase
LNLAERLSAYVSSIKYSDLGEDVLLEVKRRIIDSLGCAIGAFNAEPVRIARKVSEIGKGDSTILGTRMKTSPDLASFVNGIMLRYFDYNDTYLSKEPAHPSDNISACLAVAESEKASGKDLLLSCVLAYEIQCRLCDVADIRHRGWDHVCYGLVSSALAAAKLMNLSEEKMTQAVNIALNGHIAMRQVRAGELSHWKGCSFANAARNAVFSALLAKEGMTGPSPIFEGEMGFFKQISDRFELDPDEFGGRGSKFKILETFIKYFPAEYHSQSAIWAALEIREQIKDVEQIDRVEIASHEAGYTILGKDPEKWNPVTRETADHSLPYIVGMALIEGKINNATYSEKKFRDAEILKFLKRITVREDESLTKMYPRSIANRVSVKLTSGEAISKQVNDPRGHPKNPMSNDEIESKFGVLAKYFSEYQRREALRRLWNLDKEKDVSTLTRIFLIR